MLTDILTKWFSEDIRPKYVALTSAIFALLYHTFIFFVFLHLDLMPMVYFNIVSITIFTAFILMVGLRKIIIIPYIIATIEVIAHQIFAIHFLGADTAFQYLVLIMGLLPFLIMGNKFKISIPLATLSTLVFMAITVFRTEFPQVYYIEPSWTFAIRAINVSSSVILIFLLVLIFSYITAATEYKLEYQVIHQASALETQTSRIIEMQNNTIISLSNLVENRDSDTGHHILRTREYVRLLAIKSREAGLFKTDLTPYFIELLVKSAPMHDIGKIVVPDNILKKPGKLTPEEFDEIKKHTIAGNKIINDVLGSTGDKDYIKIASEIATSHHEKWDGSGYPYQIKGEDIPLSARIMALADVFDALVSPRCYKKPFTIDEAIKIIQEGIGTHFDPDLAEIFIENRDLLEQISIEYRD